MKTLTNLQRRAIQQAHRELDGVNKYLLERRLGDEIDKVFGKDGDAALRESIKRVVYEALKQWHDGSEAKWWLHAILEDEK